MGAVNARTVRQADQFLQTVPHLFRRPFEKPSTTQCKQRISTEQLSGSGKIIGDVSYGMAGDVEHMNIVVSELEGVTIPYKVVDAWNSRCVVTRTDD